MYLIRYVTGLGKRTGSVFTVVLFVAVFSLMIPFSGTTPVNATNVINENLKITSSDIAAVDFFGFMVSISGDTLVVSAHRDGNEAGSVHVFERNEGGTDNWGQVKKIVPNDLASNDAFGAGVSISGDTIVASSGQDDDDGSASGSAYVFERNEGGADNWGQVKKLTASDAAAGAQFGFKVSISGDTIVAGALTGDGAVVNSGTAYVFDRNQGGTDNWGEVKKLTASDAATGDFFGVFVGISDETVVVGAQGNDATGSAYVFERNQGGADNWGEVKKLTASDAATGDGFGCCVSISGDTIVSGSPFDDDAGSLSGSAYVFERNQGGADNWGESKKLTPSGANAGEEFGTGVYVFGDIITVGANKDDGQTGSSFVFNRNQGGADNWGEVAKLTASDGQGGDKLGSISSIFGSTIIVGMPLDDDGGTDAGAAYIFESVAVGTVKSFQEISLENGDFIGGSTTNGIAASLTNMGDLDGDGITDIAVGANGFGNERGSVFILFMNSDGTVKGEQRISNTEGNLGSVLDNGDIFGQGVTNIGDLDGDGITDLAVGAPGDDDGGFNHGAVWILFLNSDGTVKSKQKISDTQGGFTETLDTFDIFGYKVENIGDLDKDGVIDLAVGAVFDDDGCPNNSDCSRGAMYILFMNTDGTVKSSQKISSTQGNFNGDLSVTGSSGGRFGSSFANMGDLDGDGVRDIAVGHEFESTDGFNKGAVWILFMNTDGTVKSEQKISDTQGNFGGDLDENDLFGDEIASIGDLDGDGVIDLAVGTCCDNDTSPTSPDRPGAVWILFMNSDGTVKSEQKISGTQGNFEGILGSQDRFGQALANIGDLNDDGVTDLAVGAHGDATVWILFLNGVPSITPDTTPPVITVLGDNPATAECSVAYSDAGATALDDVDGDLTSNIVTGGLPIDTSSTSSGNIVTYDVSDAAGNAADKEIRTVDVEDTTDPTITAPADITVDATGVLTPVSIGVATASDNCGLDTITNDGPTAFQFGDTVVTWTATDSSGNESTATQTIAVRTPGDTKDNIISALNDLNDQVDDKKTNKEIDKAIKHMTKSLKTILPDGEHLDEKQGKKTFSEERKAIKELLKIKDGETKCKGVTSLTLEYTGADGVTITFTDKKGNVLDEFTGVVSGGEVTLTASGSKLGSTTNVSISGAITEEQSIHTSCSKPIDVGDEYGSLEISDLETIPGKTKKGILPEELQDDAQLICDSIVNVDRIFAEVAITDATAGPQNDKEVKEIAKANKEMDKAQDDLDKGKLDKAIKHYEKAWKHAQHAIKAAS